MSLQLTCEPPLHALRVTCWLPRFFRGRLTVFRCFPTVAGVSVVALCVCPRPFVEAHSAGRSRRSSIWRELSRPLSVWCLDELPSPSANSARRERSYSRSGKSFSCQRDFVLFLNWKSLVFWCVFRAWNPGPQTKFLTRYLVDPASSHMLVSKIKPCMSKYKPH